MTGAQIKAKIKAKNIPLKEVAERMGISRQSFTLSLRAKNSVTTAFLERVAEAIEEPVSYFYNELPIYTVEDYAKIQALRDKVAYQEGVISGQQQTLAMLMEKIRTG